MSSHSKVAVAALPDIPPGGATENAQATHASPNGALLAAITGSGTLALHMFVPALPAVAQHFAASAGAAQLTLTVYLIGIAGGQLIYGPLSDRFGRRPVLITALSVFLAATVAAGLAPHLDLLIAARFVQAIGACGGLVLGRAMVRDSAAPDQAARRLALLVMVMTTAPALAPLIGAQIETWMGWRGIFGVLGVFVTALLIASVLTLGETSRTRTALPHLGAMLAVYGRLLANAEFRGYAVAGACMSTSIYAFLSASPFLFVDVLHRPMGEVGFYYMAVVVGITMGSWLASGLAARLGAVILLRIGAVCGFVGAAALLLVDMSGWLSVTTMLAAMCVYALGCGMSSPTATAQAIGVDLKAIGAASGLYGFIQMSFGALCTLLAGFWHGHSAAPVAGILLAASSTSHFALYFIRRRQARAHPHSML
jgi:DHA1 family bicyclomycin/chloramphenicol resistance-like MFS transporter